MDEKIAEEKKEHRFSNKGENSTKKSQFSVDFPRTSEGAERLKKIQFWCQKLSKQNENSSETFFN